MAVSKYHSTYYLLVTTGKGNFTMEKPGWNHLTNVVKLGIAKHGTNWHHVPSDVMYWEGHSVIHAVFLPKISDLLLIKTYNQANPETVSKQQTWDPSTLPCHGQRRQGTHRIKDTKDVSESGLDHGFLKKESQRILFGEVWIWTVC